MLGSVTRDQDDVAIATVTDDAFVEGTAVLLWSLRRHGFTGDVVVIHGGRQAANERVLASFGRVVLQPASAELKARLRLLAGADPVWLRGISRFMSLEAFRPGRYRRVLYLDSDILCVNDFAAVWEHRGAFLACPDRANRAGEWRDAATFRRRSPVPGGDTARYVTRCFNAGVFLVEPRSLGETTYGDLLALVRPETFASIQTGHTDQIILNLYLGDRVHFLPSPYNVIVKDGFRPENDTPVFLHFVGRPKPWRTDPVPDDPGRLSATATWRSAWTEMARDLGRSPAPWTRA